MFVTGYANLLSQLDGSRYRPPLLSRVAEYNVLMVIFQNGVNEFVYVMERLSLKLIAPERAEESKGRIIEVRKPSMKLLHLINRDIAPISSPFSHPSEKSMKCSTGKVFSKKQDAARLKNPVHFADSICLMVYLVVAANGTKNRLKCDYIETATIKR